MLDRTGMAAIDLGLGDMLGRQMGEETEEQKKKRLEMKQMGSQLMSPAAQQLLGGFTGRGGDGALAF